MLFRFLCISLVSGALTLPVAPCDAAQAAETHTVKLVRPYKVGSEYKTEATAFVKHWTGADVIASAGELRGTVKVLAVNEKTGAVTKLQCTVAKLAKDGKEVCPSGAVMVAERAPHQPSTMTVNGQPVPLEVRELLGPMLGLGGPAATVSDDEVYGTDRPQPVGVARPIDKQFAERQVVEDTRIPVVPGSTRGETKIIRMKSVGGVDAMLVRLKLAYDLPPAKDARPGATPIEGGSISDTYEILLPVDPSKPPISMTDDSRFSALITVPSHGQLTTHIDIQLSRHDEPIK
jgi:hypothetical protein